VPKVAKVFRFKLISRPVAAGTRTKLQLKLPTSALAAVRRALARGRHPTAKLKITATDGAGNKQAATRRLSVVR
jgi:hypothetical protein